MMKMKCAGLLFTSDFDSGNLSKVEHVPSLAKDAAAENSTSSSSSVNSQVGPKKCTSTKSFQNLAGSCFLHSKSDLNKTLTKSHSTADRTKNKMFGMDWTVSPNQKKNKSIVSQSSCVKRQRKVLEFKVWTKPDCAGSEYENGNRTWFHFGVEGGPPGALIKIHVMNLNRQGKLYFYGMSPVFRIIPGKESWKRIPGKVRYKNEEEGNFTITFTHPLPSEAGATIYFAFTFPFSYSECQQMLDNIDNQFGSCLYYTRSNLPTPNELYYCRELLCHSLDGHKVELLTVTSCQGLTMDREPRFPFLFPDNSKPRCHIFSGKKVVFISSRVHPGETPSSFVFNGLLHFLLCEHDPRAMRLRHQFVFKLIPMLNPDGVFHGHYRTDIHGINLNRVYLLANPQSHPSIYAARTLLLHYHVSYSSSSMGDSSVIYSRTLEDKDLIIFGSDSNIIRTAKSVSCVTGEKCTFSTRQKQSRNNKEILAEDQESKVILHTEVKSSPSSERKVSFKDCVEQLPEKLDMIQVKAALKVENPPTMDTDSAKNAETSCSYLKPDIYKSYQFAEEEHCSPEVSELDIPGISVMSESSSDSMVEEDLCDGQPERENKHISSEDKIAFQPPVVQKLLQPSAHKGCSKTNSEVEASDADEEVSTSLCMETTKSNLLQHKKIIEKPKIDIPLLPPEESGIAFYVDLHGHASKRGCFLYGNYFLNVDKKVECMLLAKLMSINCPHFDFSACNFSAQNMYQGGNREGQSKEGSGRVSLYTLTGIIHRSKLESFSEQGQHSVFSEVTLCSDFRTVKNFFPYAMKDDSTGNWDPMLLDPNFIFFLDQNRLQKQKSTDITSYTLECNYNTSRNVTSIPRMDGSVTPPWQGRTPPLYTPEIYHQVGRALVISMLDSVGENPSSRVPHSAQQSLEGVRDWIKRYVSVAKSKNGGSHHRDRHHSWTAGISSPGKIPPISSISPNLGTRRSSIHLVSPQSKISSHGAVTAAKSTCIGSDFKPPVVTRSKKNLISSWKPPVSNRQLLSEFEHNYKGAPCAKLPLPLRRPITQILPRSRTVKSSSVNKINLLKARTSSQVSNSCLPHSKAASSQKAKTRKDEIIIQKGGKELQNVYDGPKELLVHSFTKSLSFPRRSGLMKSKSSEGIANLHKTNRQPSTPIQALRTAKGICSKARRRYVLPCNKTQDQQRRDMLLRTGNMRQKKSCSPISASVPTTSQMTQSPEEKESHQKTSPLAVLSSPTRSQIKRCNSSYTYMTLPKVYSRPLTGISLKKASDLN